MVSSGKHGTDRFFFIVTALFALILFMRIVFLVCFGSNGEQNTYTDPVVSRQVVRGTITDRNGTILAIETVRHACALLLKSVGNLDDTANALAPALDMSAQEIKTIAAKYVSYALIKRDLTDAQQEAVRQTIKENRLTGVVIEKRYGRSYPQHHHAAQTIGFTNSENQGIEGLELQFERVLSPYPELHAQTTYGADIQLTLDMDIQYLLDEQAVAIDREHHGDYVIGIVMGAKTGEILAATTFPWYDPNAYSSSLPEQRQNRIATYMYEPGSVFKVFSLAAIIEAGQANLAEPFECDGSYTFKTVRGSDVTIQCVSAHGTVGPAEMIKKSCNGAVAHWALQTGDEAFRSFLESLHFGSSWNIGLRGEIDGLVAQTSAWSARTKPTMAFGQEIGVTALQMATAATAIANEGWLTSPSIVLQAIDQEGIGLEGVGGKPASVQVMAAETARDLLTYMAGATQTGGTGRLTAVTGVDVASKTGTAQILDPATSSYKDGTYLASTLSLVPAADPRYIIYIAVANPKGSTIWGSNIAAPAIRAIIEGLVRQGKLTSSESSVILL